jgi:hypothetical protein
VETLRKNNLSFEKDVPMIYINVIIIKISGKKAIVWKNTVEHDRPQMII